MKRADRHHHQQLKIAKLTELMNHADNLNRKHDSAGLFSLIHKYSPRTRYGRMQLRASSGQMATPHEGLSILTEYAQRTWNVPTDPLPTMTCHGNPINIQQLELALRRIPCNKAVAAPYAEGIVWNTSASELVMPLYSALEQWWADGVAFVRLGNMAI